METENTNQSTNQAQIIPENQPSQSIVNNQKGNVPIIIGVILLLLIVGGGSYFLGFQKDKSIQSNNPPVLTYPSPATSTSNQTQTDNTAIPNWKTHTNTEGKYTVQYPQDWVLEIFKEKYPYNASYDKGYIVFQSRATTAKEKADDAPGLPVDMATGSIKIITTESMRGTEFAKILEQDFFNPNNSFWLKGNAGGGGPGYTYSTPEETKIAEKRAIKQISHPTTAYEWVGPNQITTNYYIWLGNPANEVVAIAFTYDDKNPNKDSLIKNFNQMLSTFKFQ